MESGLNTIEAITKFIFIGNKPKKSDLIIVPGSSQSSLPQKAISLYLNNFAKKIIFTGGFNSKIDMAESIYGKIIALKHGVSEKDIFCEDKSTNTKENAQLSYRIVKKHHLKRDQIILVSKPYHSRRLLMTFSKVFPRTKFIIVPVKDQTNISQRNWWKKSGNRDKVIEELSKICTYYSKGDLSLKQK